MRVYKVRDAQFPIGVELNNGHSKLTIKAATELYESLGKELGPLSDHAVLGEGWRDVREEVPENSNMVLGAWVEICDEVKLWKYAVVKYNRFLQNEWMEDTEVVKVEFWKVIDPPAFA